LALFPGNVKSGTHCVDRRDVCGWLGADRGGNRVSKASAMPARRCGFLMYSGLPVNRRMKLSNCSRSLLPLCCNYKPQAVKVTAWYLTQWCTR